MITRNSAGLYPWSKDLEASSDVRLREREGFAMLWAGWKNLSPGADCRPAGRPASGFGRNRSGRSRARSGSSINGARPCVGIVRWLEYRKVKGGEVRSLPERLRDAVDRAGARQGKSVRTRETYGRWAAMFAVWAGDERAVMRPDKGAGSSSSRGIPRCRRCVDSST